MVLLMFNTSQASLIKSSRESDRCLGPCQHFQRFTLSLNLIQLESTERRRVELRVEPRGRKTNK